MLFLPSRRLVKRKYFPSGVHRPQHSWGESFQFGSKGWGWPPSRLSSQYSLKLVFRSLTVARIFCPSGEIRTSPIRAVSVASFLASDPSGFAS